MFFRSFSSRLAFTLVLIVLFVMAGLCSSPARADEVDDPEEFMEELVALIQAGDQQGIIQLIVQNPATSKQVFNIALQALEEELQGGTPPSDSQVQIVDGLLRIIAAIHQEKLKDPSLAARYNAFAAKHSGGAPRPGGMPPATPAPGDEPGSIDSLLDHYEKQLARGIIQPGDDVKLNKLLDDLKAGKDYMRLIRREEMVARLFDNVGLYEKSIQARRKILEEYAPPTGDNDRMIRSCLRLANSYYLNSDLGNALKYFNAAIEYCGKKPSDMATLARYVAAVNLLDIYRSRQNTGKAAQSEKTMEAEAKRVQAIPKTFRYEPQDFFLYVTSITRLGDGYRNDAINEMLLGNQEKAGKAYMAMLAIYTRLYNDLKEGRHFISGRSDLARAFMAAVKGLTVVYRDVGRLEESGEFLGQIAELNHKIPQEERVLEDDRLFVDTIMAFAQTSQEAAQKQERGSESFQEYFQLAISFYRMAIATSTAISDNVKLINAHLGLSAHLIENADLSKGEYRKEIEDSLAQAKKHSTDTIKYPLGIIIHHLLTAQYAEKTGDLERAKDNYLKAIDEVEKLVAFATEDSQEKLQVLKQVEYLYRKASELLIKKGEPQTAFELLQRLQNCQEVTSLDLSRVKVRDPRLQEAIGRARALRTKTAQVEVELEKEKGMPAQYRDTAKIERLTGTLAGTKAEFYSQVNTIRAANPEFERLMAVKPAVFAKIQKTIPHDTILVQYFPAPDRLYVFLVTREDFRIKTVNAGVAEINGLVRDFRKAMDGVIRDLEAGARPASLEKGKMSGSLTRLYEILISPIEADLAKKKVMAVIPTGLLYYLPFHALAREEAGKGFHFVTQDREVVYLTSASLYETAQEKPRQGTAMAGTALAIGDPDGSLKSAAKEAQDLKGIFPEARIFTGSHATKDKVQHPGGQISILHLATHGILNSRNVNESYILMAGTGEKSRLTQGEIFEIPLEGSTLVTLSACKTALGETSPGSEIASLASAFSIAGTPSILASLWSVFDDSTGVLMIEFYNRLKEGKSKSEAIRAAQLKLLEDPRYSHPFYWAPFILMGDWR
jgi:CHAT domain-containing protein